VGRLPPAVRGAAARSTCRRVRQVPVPLCLRAPAGVPVHGHGALGATL